MRTVKLLLKSKTLWVIIGIYVLFYLFVKVGLLDMEVQYKNGEPVSIWATTFSDIIAVMSGIGLIFIFYRVYKNDKSRRR